MSHRAIIAELVVPLDASQTVAPLPGEVVQTIYKRMFGFCEPLAIIGLECGLFTATPSTGPVPSIGAGLAWDTDPIIPDPVAGFSPTQLTRQQLSRFLLTDWVNFGSNVGPGYQGRSMKRIPWPADTPLSLYFLGQDYQNIGRTNGYARIVVEGPCLGE